MEFFRQSSDFFLQDETLKADFMRQLETTVKMSELMGGTMSGTGNMSAEEMQQQSYEEAKMHHRDAEGRQIFQQHVTHRGTNKNHIIRATLESIALQVCDVIDAMRADAGIDLKSLKVDGGASANNFLMQFQADMINAPVKRPQCVETTAMGAAYLAGLAVGYWKDKEDVVNNQKIDRIFTPEMEEEERKAKRKGWNKAVKYAYGWAKDEPEEEEE